MRGHAPESSYVHGAAGDFDATDANDGLELF
jgi:hypothetical protein